MADEAARPILLVEDDANDRLIARFAFEQAAPELSLVEAVDGEAAMAALEKGPLPCLVLLDIKLPKRNGLEVLAWIRRHEQWRDLPVFMLTSSSEASDVDRAYELGVNAYYVKGVDIEATMKLAAAIALFLTLRAAG